MKPSNHKINSNFFEKIDTPEKAYVFGFFCADGYNSGYSNLEFYQLEENKDILEKIQAALDTDYLLQSKVQKTNGKVLWKLSINSKKMCSDLTRLGAVKNKSLILEFPQFITPKLLSHFIRGYFDGDGCIWNGKRRKMVVNDSTCKEGRRTRIVHNVKITFTGNTKFITSLQDVLVHKLQLSYTKLNFSKSKGAKHVCTLEYSGRKNIHKFYSYMYKDATIFSIRKYNKFKEIICALEEKSSSETGLIAGTPEMVISSEASKEERSSTIPEMEVESSDSKCPALNK